MKPMNGKNLEHHGAIYGVPRKRWLIFAESKRRYRQRILAAIRGALYVCTEETIRGTVKDICIGLRRVRVAPTGNGIVSVDLLHTWWSWPLCFYNRRLALFACKRIGNVGTQWNIT